MYIDKYGFKSVILTRVVIMYTKNKINQTKQNTLKKLTTVSVPETISGGITVGYFSMEFQQPKTF